MKRPKGISRWLFRLPIHLYRIGLGWLLGGRFMLLTHTGRRSGAQRHVVIEVVGRDESSGGYVACSGFGPRADWYLNILQTPQVRIQVGRRKLQALALAMTPAEGGEAMVGYARHRRTAAQAGGTSTGHALLGETWGPLAVNLGFAPGSSSLAQMIARMSRGILVSDLWYTRVLDPRTLVMTGLTRNGAWLVQGGEIVKPVHNFRFTQSYAEALGPGRVLGIGAEVTPQPTLKELNTFMCPALHLASWSFTGGASG